MFINYNFESPNPWSEYFCSQQIHFTKVLSGHTKATQSEQFKRVRDDITFFKNNYGPNIAFVYIS